MNKKKSLKVMTFLGTRPEIIRLSRVMVKLDEYVNHIIVHTGQNYDYELDEIFFNDLDIRKPDYFLKIDIASLGASVGDILKNSEKVLIKEKPDAVIVLGDTNSCLAAYMAKRLHIPIYHIEAGNRCFDFNVPEEINRRIIDHIADFNLVYTENARRHLLSEGLPHRRIYLTGSPLYEVINYYKNKIESSTILGKLKLTKKKYFIVSMHREENVDNKGNLKILLETFDELASIYKLPIIVSTHPRTRERIKDNYSNFSLDKKIKFLKPFGFSDYINLQLNALCTISDSGTISEESSILGFPAVTIRNALERPEAMDSGAIILTGLDKRNILNSIQITIDQFKSEKEIRNNIPNEYKISNTSSRVIKLVIGTHKLSNIWNNIN